MEYKKAEKIEKKLSKLERSQLTDIICDLIDIINGELGNFQDQKSALESMAEFYKIKEFL